MPSRPNSMLILAYQFLYERYFKIDSSMHQAISWVEESFHSEQSRLSFLGSGTVSGFDESHDKTRVFKLSRKHPYIQSSIAHSLLFLKTAVPHSQFEVVIMGRRSGYIDSTGGSKVYKVGVKCVFSGDGLISHEPVLIEVLNRSQASMQGKKVRHQLKSSMISSSALESRSELLTRRIHDVKDRVALVGYKVHRSTHFKVDLKNVITHYQKENKLNYQERFAVLEHLSACVFDCILEYHSRNDRMHADIKLENFVMNAKGGVTLIDELDEVVLNQGVMQGTAEFFPPQKIEHNKNDMLIADFFAASMSLLYELMTFAIDTSLPEMGDLLSGCIKFYDLHAKSMGVMYQSIMTENANAQSGMDFSKLINAQRKYSKFLIPQLDAMSRLYPGKDRFHLIDLLITVFAFEHNSIQRVRKYVQSCFSGGKSEPAFFTSHLNKSHAVEISNVRCRL